MKSTLCGRRMDHVFFALFYYVISLIELLSGSLACFEASKQHKIISIIAGLPPSRSKFLSGHGLCAMRRFRRRYVSGSGCNNVSRFGRIGARLGSAGIALTCPIQKHYGVINWPSTHCISYQIWHIRQDSFNIWYSCTGFRYILAF